MAPSILLRCKQRIPDCLPLKTTFGVNADRIPAARPARVKSQGFAALPPGARQLRCARGATVLSRASGPMLRDHGYAAPATQVREPPRMSCFAIPAMAMIEVHWHPVNSLPYCPVDLYYARKLLLLLWRREWDSNPRYLAVNTLSKRAPSATRPSLQRVRDSLETITAKPPSPPRRSA